MEDSAQPLQRVQDLVKNNLLTVALASFGLIFLSIGLIQLILPKPAKIDFEKSGEVFGENTNSETLQIDVSGEVINPGVYALTAESRIQDALVAAGGLSPNADRDYVAQYVNLAQPVNDGMKLYFPKVNEQAPAQGSTFTTSSIGGKINVNTAAESELDTLPGVGPVTAQKIISGRPYGKIEDLKEKKIVNSSTFEKIKEKISIY